MLDLSEYFTEYKSHSYLVLNPGQVYVDQNVSTVNLIRAADLIFWSRQAWFKMADGLCRSSQGLLIVMAVCSKQMFALLLNCCYGFC